MLLLLLLLLRRRRLARLLPLLLQVLLLLLRQQFLLRALLHVRPQLLRRRLRERLLAVAVAAEGGQRGEVLQTLQPRPASRE